MGIKVAGLDKVRAALGRLRLAARVPVLEIDGLPQTEEQKIQWLVEGRKEGGRVIQPARDFLVITPELAAKMATALAKGLAKVAVGGSLAAAWESVGQVYLKALQDRVGFSGGDLAGSLAPLKESTVRAKGGNTRLFYDSGDLLKALMKARIKVIFPGGRG